MMKEEKKKYLKMYDCIVWMNVKNKKMLKKVA